MKKKWHVVLLVCTGDLPFSGWSETLSRKAQTKAWRTSRHWPCYWKLLIVELSQSSRDPWLPCWRLLPRSKRNAATICYPLSACNRSPRQVHSPLPSCGNWGSGWSVVSGKVKTHSQTGCPPHSCIPTVPSAAAHKKGVVGRRGVCSHLQASGCRPLLLSP